MSSPEANGRLAVIGGGGWGREVLDIIDALASTDDASGRRIRLLGVFDDSGDPSPLIDARGVSVLGGIDQACNLLGSGDTYVIAIGAGEVRRDVVTRLSRADAQPGVLIHPMASVGQQCTINAGVVINVHATVTTNVVLGRHCQVHANAAIGHDSVLGDFVSVFPGATVSGSVELDEGVTIGTGANVLPGVHVGAGAMVGAGAVVTRDVAPHDVVTGVPASSRSIR